MREAREIGRGHSTGDALFQKKAPLSTKLWAVSRSGFSTKRSTAIRLAAGQRFAALDVAVAGVGATGLMPNVTSRPSCAAAGRASRRRWKSAGEAMTWSDGCTSIKASDRAPAATSGGGDRRAGVARLGFEQDRLRLECRLLQLVVDQEAVIVVADQQRRGEPRRSSARRGVRSTCAATTV